jgi:hypothetical protein
VNVVAPGLDTAPGRSDPSVREPRVPIGAAGRLAQAELAVAGGLLTLR